MKQETLSWGERPVCTPWTKFASSQVQQVPAQTGAKPIMYVHPLFSCRSISAYHGRPLVLQRDYLVLLQRFGRFLTCRSPASSYRDSQYCGMMGSAALAKVPRHFRTQGATEYVVSTGLPYGTNRTVLGEDVHSRKAFTVNLDQINPPPPPSQVGRGKLWPTDAQHWIAKHALSARYPWKHSRGQIWSKPRKSNAYP